MGLRNENIVEDSGVDESLITRSSDAPVTQRANNPINTATVAPPPPAAGATRPAPAGGSTTRNIFGGGAPVEDDEPEIPRTMSQGSGYTESIFGDAPTNSDLDVNDSDDPDTSDFTMEKLLTPQNIIILVVFIIVIVVIFAVVIHKRKEAKNGEDPKAQTTTESTYEVPPMVVFDDFDDTELDDGGNDMVTFDDDFNVVVNDTGNDVFLYSKEQIEKLRAAGYVAREIEEAEHNCVPYEQLILDAEKARDEYISEKVAPLYDTTTEEWRKRMNETWFGLDERYDMGDYSTGKYLTHNETHNLDYEKIEVHGQQCLIKVYLDDNVHENYFFMSIMPERWCELDSFGNMVINYQYICPQIEDENGLVVEDSSRMYIISAVEQRVER